MEHNDEKSSFILYTAYLEQIDELTDQQAGQLFKAILHNESGAETAVTDPVVQIAFSFVRAQLRRDREKYLAKVAQLKENGKKGGRPPKADSRKPAVINAEKPNGFDVNQSKAKNPVYVYADEDELYPPLSPEGDSVPPAGESLATAKKSRKFIKPAAEIAAYCHERGNAIDARIFFDFYEGKGWRVGQSPMRDWKATLRTWEQRNKNTAQSCPSPTAATGYEQHAHKPGDLDYLFNTHVKD